MEDLKLLFPFQSDREKVAGMIEDSIQSRTLPSPQMIAQNA